MADGSPPPDSKPRLEGEELERSVSGRQWYHTLELAPGVVTQGWFDTRSVAGRVPMPSLLTGRRCLDVGTFDGFWAFEMERRGASEVVAVDVLDPEAWDWPAGSTAAVKEALERRQDGGAGFEIARRALGSSVRRLERSVYDLREADLGSFEFVYLGSLLVHLRDPVLALERVRAICGGQLLVVDTIDPLLTMRLPRRPAATLDGLGRPWWWTPNQAGIVRMVEAAGFRLEGRPRRLYMPRGAGQEAPPVSPKLLLTAEGRQAAISAWKGDPHVAVLARPI